MAYTSAQRNALMAALATGAQEVTEGGKTVRYHSREAMLDQLALMNAELGDTGTEPPRMSVASVRMD